METTTMPLQAVWSSVLVDDGEQCVTMDGEKKMPMLCVDNLDCIQFVSPHH